MSRAAIEEMTVLREMIQSSLDAGVISDRSQLLAVAAQHGLTITRNGTGYAGFLTKSEKRFRVRFDFNDHVPKKPRVARARAVEPIEQQDCTPALSSSEAKPHEALTSIAQPSERKKKMGRRTPKQRNLL
ncbi:hypothetical protein [Pseudomonas corrugata]|uniref:hypothetical protein n=1 Tax=Pseudomonas corrugata TaxID=47879 RepID=UPI0015869260|nr:hypothetical protein [Pseudomonas corrugata]MCI0992269.1 hypothetical protein [Pseudomonas corrugata]NUT65902.1 hypothetical protein [Pseudomonas corrugata]